MIKQKELVSKRRFEEFQNNDFWKQYNLKDITQKIGSGKTPRGGSSVYIKSGIPLLRSQNINNDQVDFEEVVYISESMDEEMLNSRVSQNDVLLNITGASIGRSAVYKHAKSANVNQHVCIIRPNQEFNSRFIQLNLTSIEGQKQIDINQAGGAREGLNFQQIGKMNFYYPGYKEQQKIGQFFKHLDEMITLEQRKIDKTMSLKSAYLAEMFPGEGERVPKRRFAGFTDDWKLLKLKDLIVSEEKGRARADMIGNESTYLDASYLNGGEKLTVESPSNVNPEDVLILWDGSQAGKVYHGFKGALGSTLKALQPIESGSFIYYYLFCNQKKIFEQYRTPNIPHVINTFTDEFMISKPSLDEQLKIGDFLKKIDNIITTHQRKLDKLKATKQAYLHEMFV